MPPRHAFWTIIYGNAPTSFRAAERDELLPTLKQLQSKHPDAVLMWFARGRLWTSPEEAREALFRQRATRPDKHRPADRRERRASGEPGRDWRPGGQHRDPRDRFKVPRDVRRKRFAARVRRTGVPPKPSHKKKDDE